MKKVMAVVLSIVTVFSLMPGAIASNGDIGVTAESQEIEQVITGFLHDSVQAVYFYDKNSDVLGLTIDVLPEEKVADSVSSISAHIAPMKETFRKEQEEIASVSDVDYLRENIGFYDDGLKYFAHIYEAENIKYSWFEEEVVVTDIVIQERAAEVSVAQRLDYQYIDCDEPTSEIIHYYFVMIKDGDRWLVAAVDTDNDFYNSYKGTPFVLEAEIGAFDRAKSLSESVAADNRAETIPEETGAVSDAVMAVAGVTVAYDRDNAANYALTYSTQSDDTNNLRYPTYKNGDFLWSTAPCMLFASQCVWAGFGGSNSFADIHNMHMMDTDGTSTSYQWYSSDEECTPSWWSCKNFRTYVINSRGATDKGLYCETLYVESDQQTMKGVRNVDVPFVEKAVVESDHGGHYSVAGTKSSPFTSTDLKGAVIHGYGSGGILGHALVCNNATGIDRDEMYVTAYNYCRKNKLLSLVYPIGWSNMHDLYIVVPKTFREATTGTRLYAKLENAYGVGRTLTLTGYSSAQVASLTIKVYGEGETTAADFNTVQNRSVVQLPFTFTSAGTWRVEVSSPGLSTYTYRVRIV